MATDHRVTGERTSDEQRIAEELGALLRIDPEKLSVRILAPEKFVCGQTTLLGQSHDNE